MVELTINNKQRAEDVFTSPRRGTRTLTIDAETEEEIPPPDPLNPRIAIIRTSDRIAFKNCRRRWGWSSHLRHNLGPKYGIGPLWFGTGIHFALEDFHGYNRFGHPKAAFEAFVKASKLHSKEKLPDGWEELLSLGQGMMDYYVVWLQLRPLSRLRTYWVDGVPQVEVNFRFRIPGDWTKFGYDEVYYSGTIDRICIDEHGYLWPLDYKTAKNMETLHFMTDPQVNAYMWAAPFLYDKPIGGFKYMQLKKAIPNPGRLIYGGSKISTAENQSTSHYMYRQTLIDFYGSVDASPMENQAFLTKLAQHEDENRDDFIQVDSIARNERMGQSEGVKILMEIEDMLNPDLPLYPNPTRFCMNTWNPEQSCPFVGPCVSMDDGSDWLYELEQTTDLRETKYDAWRTKLIFPDDNNQIVDPRQLDLGDRSWLDTTPPETTLEGEHV